jgi:transposase
MRCEETVRIIEVLRLWDMKMTQRQIAAAANCARSTVGEIQKRCTALGMDHAKALEYVNANSFEALQRLIYPSLESRPDKPDPEWKTIHGRLTTRKRLNLQYIWEEEYRKASPDPMSYSQFCRRYRAWRDRAGLDTVMALERAPGYELFVDWAGDLLEGCVTDSETGQAYNAHLFVAALGNSGYPYAEAAMDETTDSWIRANINALEWYGGMPAVIKPDNCRTAITKASRYDPVINPVYAEFAEHYGVAIVPARVRKPRDKGLVEGSVGYLETWLMEWLRGRRFGSFEELNQTIRERVRELAARPFKKRAGSREEAFRLVDRPALRGLPASRFERAEYAKRTVPDNYHVEFDGFCYSVPYQLYRHGVTIRATDAMIEVMDKERRRVALHKRKRTGGRYATNTAHMPERYRRQKEANERDGDSYRAWAKTFGPETASAVDAILRAGVAEQTGYRSCMGLMQLGKSHGAAALEDACRSALSSGEARYSVIKSLIENPPAQPAIGERPLPGHENLRGPSAFI